MKTVTPMPIAAKVIMTRLYSNSLINLSSEAMLRLPGKGCRLTYSYSKLTNVHKLSKRFNMVDSIDKQKGHPG